MRDDLLKTRWTAVKELFSTRFADGDEMDLDGILFLIGIQEAGKGNKRYKKDEKIDVMHVAICTLLIPYGYYEFEGLDEQGWPHFRATATLPNLKPGEQAVLMKEAVVNYALENEWIK